MLKEYLRLSSGRNIAIGVSMSVITEEERCAKHKEECLARLYRYNAIKAQSQRSAVNDLKLQSSSPIWDNSYMTKRFADYNQLSDEDLEATVLAEQEYIAGINKL